MSIDPTYTAFANIAAAVMAAAGVEREESAGLIEDG
jgi:hypothetical protein